MITIICTTDRSDSNSRRVSEIYRDKLIELNQDVQLFDLRTVKPQWVHQSSYGDSVPEFDVLVEKYIRSVQKLVLVTPEYNGSFPGFFKCFMDACDHGDFKNKKIALVGLATGRSGNVRGLDHLTGILHYLTSEVYCRKVYLSQVDKLLSGKANEMTDLGVSNEIDEQLNGFIAF